VETGTFRGTTTEFLLRESGVTVYTVEAAAHYYHFARLRFRGWRNLCLELGDSRAFLEKLARDPAVPKSNVFFYLDSHWEDDLPLHREIELITGFWRGVVIMVDDFQVPGDAGYGYDTYGSGIRLCLEHLQPLSPLGLTPFFPALPSEQETGRKRGCVVLADGIAAERLEHVQSLKRF
jgi:hypothetical protein